MELEKRVIKFIRDYNLLDGVHEVAVATSGGADSMALLTFLNNNKEQFKISKVLAIHVNHGIRGETADRDERFVVEYCLRHHIECIVHRAKEDMIEIPNNASEVWARELRYNYFERVKKEHGYDKIAIAHTASDQAETVLFRIARGTGLKGISGIHKERGYIVRPFMCLDRNDIEELCRVYGISYITDETNLGDDYSRNKIRHRVIPTLVEVNDRAILNLVELSNRVTSAHGILEKLAKNILKQGLMGSKKVVPVDKTADSYKDSLESDENGVQILCEYIVMVDKIVDSLHSYKNSLGLDEDEVQILCEYIVIEILNKIRLGDGYSSKKSKGILNIMANSLHRHTNKTGIIVSVDISDNKRIAAKKLNGGYVWVYKDTLLKDIKFGYTINSIDTKQSIRIDAISLSDYLREIVRDGESVSDTQIKVAMHNRGNFKKYIEAYCDKDKMRMYTGISCRKEDIEVVFGSKVHKQMKIEIDGEVISVRKRLEQERLEKDCVVIYNINKVNALWVNGLGVDDRYLPMVKDKIVYKIQCGSGG